MANPDGIWLRAYPESKDSLQGSNAASFGLWWWIVFSAAIKRQALPCGMVLERAQLIVSCRGLEERLRMPRQSVSRFLKLWEEDGAIKRQELGRKGTIITICNFDTYQPLGRDGGTQTIQKPSTNDPQRDSKSPQTKNPKNPKNPERKTKGASPRRGFVKPSVEEVAAYCDERRNGIDPQSFVDHYESCGWVQGKSRKPVVDWKACVRTWEGNRRDETRGSPQKPPARSVTQEDLLAILTADEP